jgi:L-threonylcarbamoyladenylate synthase
MRAQILLPSPDSLRLCAEALLRDEVVGMPTETVYGLAGAAFQPEALARIFETKERPTFDPLIIHVGMNSKSLFALADQRLVDMSCMSDTARLRAELLIRKFWPGPLTLVLPKHGDVPELATSGLASVALRMPSHRVALQLLAEAGIPLAAPSANRFGRISPTTAQAVADELGDRIDLILDGGPCEVGVESTVIRVETDGALTQLRPGGLARSVLEEAAGCEIQVHGSSANPGGNASTGMAAPGMLASHYAPSKPMHLLPARISQLEANHWQELLNRAGGNAHELGFLLQSGDSDEALESEVRQRLTAAGLAGSPSSVRLHFVSLTRTGDLHEAARRLFSCLRQLDESPAQVLFAEPILADRGLGHAIADRLSRACAKRS